MPEWSYTEKYNNIYVHALDNIDTDYHVFITTTGIDNYPYQLTVRKGDAWKPIFEEKGNETAIYEAIADVINGYYLNITPPSRELFNKLSIDRYPKGKYWFEWNSWRYYNGHYWNDDIKAYTPEGDYDRPGDSGRSKIFNSWEELLDSLEEKDLLADEVLEDITPEDIEKGLDKENHAIWSYKVEKDEQEDEDDMGHVEFYSEVFEITIYGERV